jgi:hypothetical protein
MHPDYWRKGEKCSVRGMALELTETTTSEKSKQE